MTNCELYWCNYVCGLHKLNGDLRVLCVWSPKFIILLNDYVNFSEFLKHHE